MVLLRPRACVCATRTRTTSLHCFRLPHTWRRWVQYQHSLNWITADELLDVLARLPP
jgi:hypothetical protein